MKKQARRGDYGLRVQQPGDPNSQKRKNSASSHGYCRWPEEKTHDPMRCGVFCQFWVILLGRGLADAAPQLDWVVELSCFSPRLTCHASTLSRK